MEILGQYKQKLFGYHPKMGGYPGLQNHWLDSTVEEIIFDAKEAARGIYVRPQPSLPFGAAVITIHRGEILPGAWEEDCFVYPANQRDLAVEAARAAVTDADAIYIGDSPLAGEERFAEVCGECDIQLIGSEAEPDAPANAG